MTLTPRYDSPNPATRKIMWYVCDETGKCYSSRDAEAFSLSGSSNIPSVKSRLTRDKSLSEILLGEKPYASE